MPLLQRPYGPNPGNPSGLNAFAQNTQAAQAKAVLPAQLAVVATAEQVVPNPLNITLPLCVQTPPQAGCEQIPLDLNVSGYIKTTSSGSVTLKVYSGSSLTVGSNTLLGTTGAQTQNTLTSPFWIKGKLLYDSVSGKLVGTISAYVNGVLIAEATLSNFITGVNDANNPVLSVVLTITASGAASGTPVTLNIQNFSIG